MKKIYLLILLVSFAFYGCKEEFIGQYAVDSTAPAPVTNVKITPLPGGAHITYDMPKESDLLYVGASYVNDAGETLEQRASAFKNEMDIFGFGKAREVQFTLFAVDRSMNKSTPVTTSVMTEKADIYNILDSMTVDATWGGVKLTWPNELETQVVVSVNASDDILGSKEIARFYSKAKFAKYFVRGLDSKETTFKITVRDTYGNITPARTVVLTPKYEVHLPVDSFLTVGKAVYLTFPDYLQLETNSSSQPMWIFQRERQVEVLTKDGYDPEIQNKYEPYMPWDMLKTYKFTRFNMFGRSGFEYTLRNARIVELWGTADQAVFDKGNDNWEGWVCLGRFESKRPSGTDYTTAPTVEDKAYGAEYGDNFDMVEDNQLPPGDGKPVECDVNARATTYNNIPVRYVRIRGLSNWSGIKSRMAISFLNFWGEETK